ncbi:MAG: transposase [Methylocella sp.]
MDSDSIWFRNILPDSRPARAIRARIEKIFGIWKRGSRLRHMRWLGLSKAKLQVHLAVIAANVKR